MKINLNLKSYLLAFMLLFVGFAFAVPVEETTFFALTEEPEGITIAQVIQYATPLVVYLAAALAIWLIGVVPGWSKQLIVMGLSFILSLVTTQLADVELSTTMQAVYGLLAIVINEVMKHFNPARTKKAI